MKSICAQTHALTQEWEKHTIMALQPLLRYEYFYIFLLAGNEVSLFGKSVELNE